MNFLLASRRIHPLYGWEHRNLHACHSRGRDEVVAPSREVLVRLNVINNGLKSSSQDAPAAVLNHPEVEFGDQVTSTNELTANTHDQLHGTKTN